MFTTLRLKPFIVILSELGTSGILTLTLYYSLLLPYDFLGLTFRDWSQISTLIVYML